MRDLHLAKGEPMPTESRVPLDAEPLDIDQQLTTVRREQRVAGMAVMLLDAAKVLEPVVELLSDKALRWAALGSTVGLTAYALREPSWERAAIVGGFGLLAAWVLRKGRR